MAEIADAEILDYSEGGQDDVAIPDDAPALDDAAATDDAAAPDDAAVPVDAAMAEEAIEKEAEAGPDAEAEPDAEAGPDAGAEVEAEAEPKVADDAMATDEKEPQAEATAVADPLSMPPHGTEVFISKIPREATVSQVRGFCEQAGEVYDVRLTKDPGNPGQNKGYAFTLFKTREGATAALGQLNQAELPDFSGKKVTIVKSEVKNKLFIGNMPREMSKETILATFSKDCKGIEGMDLMLDKESPGHNRGFGFLEFYNHSAAEAARRKLGRPEYRLGERQITVTWAEPKKNDAALEQVSQSVKSIYVGNLPETADEQKLRAIFSAYGKITGLSLLKDPQDQSKLRNYCFLHYEDRSAALKAIEECEVQKQEMDGRDLQVHMARPQPQRDGTEGAAATGSYGGDGYSGHQSGGASYGGGRGGYGVSSGGGAGGRGGGYGTGGGYSQGGRGSAASVPGRGVGRGGAGAGYGGGGGGYGVSAYGAGGGGGGRGGARPSPYAVGGRGGGHAAYAAAAVDDSYDYYGEGYEEGYDEGYEEEDYSYGGYGGYPSAGMGMIPMMMPGGQIGYVMASSLTGAAGAMVSAMGGGMGMMPDSMHGGAAPPRRAASSHGRGAGSAAAAAAAEHHGAAQGYGASSGVRGGAGARGYGVPSVAAPAGFGAAAASGGYGAPAARTGAAAGGGYVAGRSASYVAGRTAPYGAGAAAQGAGRAGYGAAAGAGARGAAYGGSAGRGSSASGRFAPY